MPVCKCRSPWAPRPSVTSAGPAGAEPAKGRITRASFRIGASAPSIIFRELLPNAIGPIIVAATLSIPAAILTESTLSFLGFGIQPPRASWGNMLQDSLVYMRDFNAWWMGVFPGMMIALTVLSFNFLGDGLRDALDPRSRID